MVREAKLGQLVDEFARRDAVHIALAPIQAAEKLKPGSPVDMIGGKARATYISLAVGVVDPYLEDDVEEGEWFYLCLFPGSVTSLRHQWDHPDFDPEEVRVNPNMSNSEIWLRAYAMKLKPYEPPERAFEHLIHELKTTKELYGHGSDLHSFRELDDADSLKEHAENYLGITIHWGEFSFTCSC